jgi:hypothetical protein
MKTNSLKVRRIDLLEQLEERFAVMTKEKAKYEARSAIYKAECDKYYKAVEAWENGITSFLIARAKKEKPTISHRSRYYGYKYSSEESWSIGFDLTFTRDDLIREMGPEPEKPECPDLPDFLREGRGYKYDRPSLYQSVYQAIQLLNLSDDEHVNASTYQMALEVL